MKKSKKMITERKRKIQERNNINIGYQYKLPYMGREARQALEDAFKQRAVKDKVIIMENATKCMEELRKYILNEEERARGIPREIERCSKVEDYEQANIWKAVLSQVQMNVERLSRVLQGLPAFQETRNETNTKTTR